MPCRSPGVGPVSLGPRPPPRWEPPPPPPHLGAQRPPLDLADALLDNEGHAVGGAAGRLAEVLAEQLQAALQLLVSALYGQRLQTFLVAGQAALGAARVSEPSPGAPSSVQPPAAPPHLPGAFTVPYTAASVNTSSTVAPGFHARGDPTCLPLRPPLLPVPWFSGHSSRAFALQVYPLQALLPQSQHCPPNLKGPTPPLHSPPSKGAQLLPAPGQTFPRAPQRLPAVRWGVPLTSSHSAPWK